MSVRRKRIGLLRNPHLVDAFLDSAQRQQYVHGQVAVSPRVGRLELDRATEALFGICPLSLARVDHPKRLVRFGQEWIQSQCLLGRPSHLDEFIIRVVTKTLKRNGSVRRR